MLCNNLLKFLDYYIAISALLCDFCDKPPLGNVLALYLNSAVIAISYRRHLVQI